MKSTKNEVTSRYETVTPQKAREYLDTSIGNRPIKAAKVQLFAQYMKAGEWNRYAQPIYFDEDGRLMDGHTRLNAVVKCGATVEMNVVRNFPRVEWNKLNSGSIWTAGDFASANGVKNANSSMSAVKIREALKRGLRIGSIGSVSKGKIQDHVWTNDDFLRLFNADKDWPDGSRSSTRSRTSHGQLSKAEIRLLVILGKFMPTPEKYHHA